MSYSVTCRCGRVLEVSENEANTFQVCSDCGMSVSIPSLSELQATAEAAPSFEMPPEVPLQFDASVGESLSPEYRLATFQYALSKLTPRVFVTQCLAGLSVLIFVLMAATGAGVFEPNVEKLVSWGANFGPLTLSGQWWRLLTCMTVHIGIIHLAFNMWVLLCGGPLVERMLGNVGFLLMYVSAGLIASLASLMWHPLMVSAGASGAIFGIYGALLAILARDRGSIPKETLAQLKSSGMGFLGYNLLFGLTQPNIDIAAHLGGLFGGFLIGLVQAQPFTSESLPGRRSRNLAAGVLCVVLLVGGAIGVSRKHSDIGIVLDKIEQGNIEVYYSNGATKADAERLAAYLTRAWAPTAKATVKVTKSAVGVQFHMILKPEFQSSDQVIEQLVFDGARMSRDVFDDAPVEVIVCDDHLRPLKTVSPRADLRHGIVERKTEVFYSAEIERDDAQRLAQFMSDLFREGPALLKLAQRGTAKEVHLGFQKEMLSKPEVVAELRRVRDGIAADVFPGTEVELHLVDEQFDVFHVLKP